MHVRCIHMENNYYTTMFLCRKKGGHFGGYFCVFLNCLFFALLVFVILPPLAPGAYATIQVVHLESNFSRLIFVCGCQYGYSAEETHYTLCVFCVCLCVCISFL